jgi:hypothetical protein
MLDIPGTGVGIDMRQHLAAPIFVETFDPGPDLVLLARLADVRQIDRQHVGAVDLLYV